jgi:hypothetical protein
VKKAKLPLKANRLTSTSDLTHYASKHRQLSGVSSATDASVACSQCSTSAPSYVGQLHRQSDVLRQEIIGLKTDIEHLQTSQDKFFEQLRAHLQLPGSEKATLSNASK